MKIEETEKIEKKCIGIIVRAHTYFKYTEDLINSSNRIINQVRLNVLKKKSCPGCNECGCIWDFFQITDNHYIIGGIGEVEHGKLYRLKLAVTSIDSYTGMVDDCDLILQEYFEGE
jgi:ferredoxin